MTTSLTAAQLDELERYLTARESNGARPSYRDDPDVISKRYLGAEDNALRASTLRALLELGREQLRTTKVWCTCGSATIWPGGAYREPSGFTHYSDQYCGPDILGDGPL